MVNNSSWASRPSWAGFGLVFLASCFIFYLTLPNIMWYFTRDTSEAKIISIKKDYLEFEYENIKKEYVYSFSRDINDDEFNKLVKLKVIEVSYSPYFPENVIIDNIGEKPRIFLPILVNLMMLMALIRSAKQLFVETKNS